MSKCTLTAVLAAVVVLAGCSGSTVDRVDGTSTSKTIESGPGASSEAVVELRSELPIERPNNVRGAVIYKEACEQCHGATGDGMGPATAYIRFAPTDLRAPGFRASADLHFMYDAISNGRPLSVMPSFKQRYSSQDLWNVSSYAFSLSIQAEGLKKGKQLYEKHCMSCHGQKGDGVGGIMESSKQLSSFADHRAMSSRSRLELSEIASKGNNDVGMPAFAEALSSTDIAAVTEYVFLFSYGP